MSSYDTAIFRILFLNFRPCVTSQIISRVLLDHQRFSSRTSQQIRIESRKRHLYDGNELPSRLISGLSHDLKDLTWSWFRGSTVIFILTQQKVHISFDAAWRDDYSGLCILALRPFSAELWVKNQNPTFRTMSWSLRSPVDPRPNLGTNRGVS